MNNHSSARTANIDWMTVTTRDARTGWNWLELFNRHKTEQQERPTTVRMHGFAGLRVGGCSWAQRERDGRFMFVCSGTSASLYWRRLSPVMGRVTRLDVAADCWLAKPIPGIPGHMYRVFASPAWDATRVRYSLVDSIKSTKLTKTRTDKSRGQTLYIGSRSSEQMGRLYDKGVQTDLAPPGMWYRYEVETKGGLATQAYMRLIEHLSDGYDLGELLTSTVYAWFRERYVCPLFSPGEEGDGIKLRSYARATTDHKKIAWLRSQVRPTIAYLFDMGLHEECLEALGLTEKVKRDTL